MRRLETFGALRLTDEAGAGLPGQRRRLALLALLAVAGPRGLSRDKLQAYLWPEGDAEGARHALEQAIYGLRRQLGEELFTGANPLTLNPAVLASDTTELEAALDRGDHVSVVRLYRGPFLDGFFVGEAPEFERWAESCRAHFAQRYVASLEALARRDEQAGAHGPALEWRRRLVAVDPYAPGPTVALMRALAAVGDSAGAIHRARVYESLIRKDFDAEPDPAVVALAGELRRTVPAHPGVEDLPLGPRLAGPLVGRFEPAGATSIPAPARRWFRWLGAALTLGALAAIAVTAGRMRRLRADGRLEANRVAVVPFRIVGPDSSLAYLSDGMVDLLAARLTGEGGPEAANSRATLAAWGTENPAAGRASAQRLGRALGAELVLEGQLASLKGSRVSLAGALRAVADGQVRARAGAEGPADSLEAVIDRFTAGLLAAAAGEREDRMAILAAVPLRAIRAYLSGRTAYRRGRYDLAVGEYGRALQLDSTFALAALELAAAAGLRFKLRPVDQAVADRGWWTEADTAWTRGIEIAWQQRDRLSAADRVYLHALRGIRFPQSTPLAEHLRAWDQVLHVTPDRADAWYRLGALLLYLGSSVEVADARGRATAAFERALALDSAFLAPLVGLVDAATFARDTAAAGRLVARYLTHDSTGDDAFYVRWRLATLTRDLQGQTRLRRAFAGLGTATLARIQWISQMDGLALDDAELAVATLLARAGSPLERTRALGLARWLALNRGRPRAARTLEDSITDIGGARYWNPLFAVVYALYWDADSSAAAAAAREVERDAGKGLRPADRFVLAQWQLRQGDRRAAGRAARAIRTTVARDSVRFGQLLSRAELLEAIAGSANAGSVPPALIERLDSVARLGCCEAPHFVNLILARLRERQQDLDGALRAVRRAQSFFPPEYLSTALREEGRLAALAGDTVAAVKAYRRFLALRAAPEPTARAETERIREAVAVMER
jgi:DNA-binding SARP family transcriptional activator